MGYKAALCERDIAIYGMMLWPGCCSRVRHWLRPAPLWLPDLGLMPLGLDRFSQLFSYPPFEFWPVRETLPRVIPGLFGLMNVWLAFPYLIDERHHRSIKAGSRPAAPHRLEHTPGADSGAVPHKTKPRL